MKTDAERGRIYLPLEELARCRVTEAEILAIHARVADEVTDAVERAQAASDAGDAELGIDDVFA